MAHVGGAPIHCLSPAVLQATELAVDGMTHKLVQPGETRWLSYDGSISVICKHYAAVCLALEAIYADAGDLSCDAGGILLELRKSSTVYLLNMLHSVLEPLARLSKGLQSSEGNMFSAMESARAVIGVLEDYDFERLSKISTKFEGKMLESLIFPLQSYRANGNISDALMLICRCIRS